jgi:hypothetical protein
MPSKKSDQTKRKPSNVEDYQNELVENSSKSTKLDSNNILRGDSFASNNTCSYWLMKSEPESRIENGFEMKFGFDDLKASKNQTTQWDGVRNYEARNFMKSMKIDDLAFFYHSNCKNPGIIGIIKVCRESYVDYTQFDAKDAHYDPKSDKSNPKWYMV